MIDIEAVRRETPGAEGVLHFDNAGAALMPQVVHRAVLAHLEAERTLGGYEAERRAESDLQAFYTEFAGLLAGHPDEIAYVENATRAWDMAVYALPLEPGDRVLVHASDYASNYLAWLQLARRKQIVLDLVPSAPTGEVDVAALEAMIGPRTRVISLTHVPTQGGLVNPAAEVGRIARRQGLIYVLDACQSAGQLVLDVGEIGCDVLTGTGRKFLRGPRGTGFLFVRRGLVGALEPPFVDLHAATWTGPDSYELAESAKRFETWESHVAGRIGLMHAVRYARGLGLAAIEARVQALATTLRRELVGIPGVSVHDLGQRQCGLVTFLKDGERAQATASRLRQHGANVSVSTLEYARLDLGRRGLPALVRASVHYYNTEAEVARFAELVAGAATAGTSGTREA